VRFAGMIIIFSLFGLAADSLAQTTADKNPGNYFCILGQITYPGTYENTEQTLSLQQLINEAGGVTSSSSGQFRIIRNGLNSKPIDLSRASQVQLLSGDVVVVDSLLKLNGLQLSTSPTANPVAADEAPDFIQLSFVNLIAWPVVVKTEIKTVTALVAALGQNPELIQSVRVITPPSALHGRPLTHLPSGSVLIFDRRYVNAAGLPEMTGTFQIIPQKKQSVSKLPTPANVHDILRSKGLLANQDSKPNNASHPSQSPTDPVLTLAEPEVTRRKPSAETQSDPFSTAVASADENHNWKPAEDDGQTMAQAPVPPAEEPYFVHEQINARSTDHTASLAYRDKSEIQAILPDTDTNTIQNADQAILPDTDTNTIQNARQGHTSATLIVAIMFMCGLGISARILWSIASHPALRAERKPAASVPTHQQHVARQSQSNLSTLIKQELPIEFTPAQYEPDLVLHQPAGKTTREPDVQRPSIKIGSGLASGDNKHISNDVAQEQEPMELTGDMRAQPVERVDYRLDEDRKIMVDPAHPGVIGKTAVRENKLRLLDRVLSQVHRDDRS